MRRIAGLFAAWTLAVLAGCSDSEAGKERPRVEEPGPDAPVAPTWDGVSAGRTWLREGFGEGRVIRSLDLDGDMSDEIFFGGRGVALLDANARAGDAPRWSLDWANDGVNPYSGGENVWTTALELVDVNGDGTPDPLVLNSDREAYAVDALTGDVLWTRRLDAEFYTTHLALLDADGDGFTDFFPAGGLQAYSARTGEPLWQAPLARPAVFVASATFDFEGGSDLLLTTEEDAIVGGPPPDPAEPGAPNVHAVSSDGRLLFEAFVEGTIVSVATGDIDGDSLDEAIVGTHLGTVYALDAGGVVWSRQLGSGLAQALIAADVDFDGIADVFAAHNVPEDRESSEVFRLDPATGEVLWTHPVGPMVRRFKVQQLDDDLPPELLVAAGLEYPSSGLAVALEVDPEIPVREQWRLEVGMPVDSFASANVDRRWVLLVGAADSQLHAVQPASGAEEWTWSGGGYVFASGAGDLDGDGRDEVASGDDRGLVIVASPVDGTRLWARRLDVGAAGQVTVVGVPDLDGDGRAEVVASAVRYSQAQDRGVIELLGADGARIAKRLLDGWPWAMQVADLDGDGSAEIVAGVRDAEGCSVRAFDRELQPLWRTPVNACEVMALDVADVNGDGAPEIAYVDSTLAGPPKVALLTGHGEVLWSDLPTAQKEDGLWVKIVPGGMVYGGFATDEQGHVTRRDETGAVVFQTLFAPVPDVAHEGANIAPGAWFGILVDDRNADGQPEVAISTDAASVKLLDGATGEERWSTTIEDMTLAANFRHFAGPLAWVPETEALPAWIAVGQTGLGRSRASSFVLSLDGEVKGRLETEGEAHAVSVFRAGDGRTAAAIGAGLGIHALELTRTP